MFHSGSSQSLTKKYKGIKKIQSTSSKRTRQKTISNEKSQQDSRTWNEDGQIVTNLAEQRKQNLRQQQKKSQRQQIHA